MRILSDRGTEFCDSAEPHEYELYLAVETYLGVERSERLEKLSTWNSKGPGEH